MKSILVTGDRFGLVGAFIAAAARLAIPAPYMDADYSRPYLRAVRPVRDWRVGGCNIAHQGTQEMARRRRQIERGQLKSENGLLRSPA